MQGKIKDIPIRVDVTEVKASGKKLNIKWDPRAIFPSQEETDYLKDFLIGMPFGDAEKFLTDISSKHYIHVGMVVTTNWNPFRIAVRDSGKSGTISEIYFG